MAASNCQCPNCDVARAHPPNRCRRRAKWFISYHSVDRCKELLPREVNVCKPCFDAHVSLAKRTIAWGMEGVRETSCQGCNAPLVRLSSIIREVGKP